jgi:hypothetical protein
MQVEELAQLHKNTPRKWWDPRDEVRKRVQGRLTGTVGRKTALLRSKESFLSQVGSRIVWCPSQGHNIVFKRKSRSVSNDDPFQDPCMFFSQVGNWTIRIWKRQFFFGAPLDRQCEVRNQALFSKAWVQEHCFRRYKLVCPWKETTSSIPSEYILKLFAVDTVRCLVQVLFQLLTQFRHRCCHHLQLESLLCLSAWCMLYP